MPCHGKLTAPAAKHCEKCAATIPPGKEVRHAVARRNVHNLMPWLATTCAVEAGSAAVPSGPVGTRPRVAPPGCTTQRTIDAAASAAQRATMQTPIQRTPIQRTTCVRQHATLTTLPFELRWHAAAAGDDRAQAVLPRVRLQEVQGTPPPPPPPILPPPPSPLTTQTQTPRHSRTRTLRAAVQMATNGTAAGRPLRVL